MKLKSGYISREIAGSFIVIPVGEKVIEFKGMITLNEVGNFLWNNLLTDTSYDELLAALLNEYDVEESVAKADLEKFIQDAEKIGVLEK